MKTRRLIFSISSSFYNRVQWVDHVYESLKAQTYPWWEWVVTDDFSDEEGSAKEVLLEICRKDARVKYYHQTRKKELFYNPQYGCSGDIVMQLDTDDYIYPNVLEMYDKYFTEDEDLMGITCGYIWNKDLYGGFVSTSTFSMKDFNCIGWAQMGRAWRNVIPHFDLNGDLTLYQNDTNMWRQIEARGKVLFLPRQLYIYNENSKDSISSSPHSNSVILENERIWMENRFPISSNDEKCSFDLRYLPIDELTWAFYTCDFNTKFTPQNLLFIKSFIKPFEKQLLNELFYDHNISYNIDKREKFDEVIIWLDNPTFVWLKENITILREKFKGTPCKFFIDEMQFSYTEDELVEIFIGYGWLVSGPTIYGRITL